MRLEITDIRTLTDEEPSVRELEFRKPPVPLGSHSENLVQLPDIAIAPRYATFDIVNDQWVFKPSIRDGLAKLNGKPIADAVELSDGDVIDITYFSMRFILDTEVAVELPEAGKSDEFSRIRQFPLPPRSEVRNPDADLSMNAARQKALADFSFRLRDCSDFAKLLETTIRLMLTEFGARAAWMGVRRVANGPLEFIDGFTDDGKYFGQPPKLELFEYRCLNRHQFISIPRTGDADTQSVLALPILASRGAIGLLYVDSKKHTRVYDGADLGFLTAVARLVTPVLEAVIDERIEAKREQTAGGLRVVKEMQARLDPKSVPDWPGLQFTAFTKSGVESAGDLYDVMRLPNGLAAVLVGHVSGDAIRIGVTVPQIRGAFRMAGLHADPPRTQLKALNWMLFDETDPCRLDAAILVANPKTGVVELATAGAIGVIQISPEGDLRRLTDPKAPPVASSKSCEYGGATIRMKIGETLAFFTPGCANARNKAGDPLGEARLVEALCDGFNRPAAAAMDELVQDLAAFFKNGRLPDDITLLLLHRPE
jgi:serine phosphatase RsbU (regulator of sigma subunit)